jgi:TonB-dependent receptor
MKPHYPSRKRALASIAAAAILLVPGAAPHPVLHAADDTPPPVAATAVSQGAGSIEGRVYLPSADRYLENALVTIDGTDFTTLTDDIGVYQFAGVPAGPVKITASFTGFPSRTLTVEVRPGQTAALDIDILQGAAPRPGTGTDGDIVNLEAFVVNADRFETGSILARNEQRYAADMRAVVSADEFGENPSGNIGEFMRHLPGVSIISENGEPRAISIDGVAPEHVPITFAGFSLANAASGSQSRQVELEGVSLSSMSRIEVVFSPTPEVEGRALAGSVNVVPRSAFEYKRPRLEMRTYLMLDGDNMTLNKTPGPWFAPTRKAGPSAALSYVLPINKRFGLTLSASRSFYVRAKEFQRTYWRGSSDGVGDSHFPLTDVSNPYLSRIDLEQGSSLNERVGFSITADWRIARNDRLSFALQYGYQDIKFDNRMLTIAIQHFDAGNANLLTPYYSEGGGYVRQHQMARRKTNTTYTPTLTWRHNGPLWKINAGIAYSHATSHYADTPYGFFYSANADRGNVRVVFDEMQYTGPRRITVTDLGGTNAPINPYALDDLYITDIDSLADDAHEKITNGFFDIRRDLRLGGSVPLFLKAGWNYKEVKRGRDHVNYPDWRYLGADGVASGPGNDSSTGIMNPPASADDGAKIFSDPGFSTRPVGFGHPNIEWVDLSKLYQMYEANPGYFLALDDDDTIANTWNVTELINSAYFRSDLYLFNNRLQIVAGVRAERTDIEGRGPLRTNIGGRMTWVYNGAHSDVSYTNWLPRVNATYEITPDRTLIARAAYTESLGRPSFNQYAGELTMPDRNASASATINRFGLKNPEIEPWTSKTFSLGLDYYFSRNGSLTARVFSREINKFFIESIEPVSEALLSHYGLDPYDYDGYYVVTQMNSSRPATVRGMSFNYSQRLTFLPAWAQGFSVYGNATFNKTSGAGKDELIDSNGAFRPKLYNAGVSFARKKYSLRAGWNYMGRTKTGINNSTNVPAGTYTWMVAREQFDVSGEYRLKHYTFFFNISNLTGEPEKTYEIHGPDTPAIARLRYMEDYAPQYTFGVKAVF